VNPRKEKRTMSKGVNEITQAISSAPEVIRIANVTKEYATPKGNLLKVLDNVSLNVKRGSFQTLIGPSGCGKSTLLGIIGGLTTATSGQVLLDNEPIDRPRPDKIATVFQDSSLLPWRTVVKNIEFGLELTSVPKEERKQRSEKYLGLVGLRDFATYYPNQISGGMMQRVNVARALTLEPEVLLMDEPFGALDEQSRLTLGAELTEIWMKTKKTIIFVTHSLTEAAFLSTHVAVMSARPGRIADKFEIDAPWPRDAEDPELVEARRRMWGLIRDQTKFKP
jgi:NitT/TauT family transport system ATP-binding protein